MHTPVLKCRPRMFQSIVVLFSLSLFPLFLTCTNGGEEISNAPRKLNNNTRTFLYNMIPENATVSISPHYSNAINTFSVKLLQNVYTASDVQGKNLVLSPFSVSRALAVLTEGAAGDSKEQLLEALGGQAALDDAKDALTELLYADKSVIFQCADALWFNSAFYLPNDTFRETVNRKYGVEVAGMDFGNGVKAAGEINNWISTNTNRCIKEVVDPSHLSPEVVLFITNAVYFEADWASPFDVTKTRPHNFYTPDGAVSVKMMSSGYIHKTRKTETFENARLYYGTQKSDFFYLDIYMPVTISIEDFLERYCLEALSDNGPADFGKLMMPKFTFTSDINLIPTLERLGIRGIFNPSNQDLSGIVQMLDSDSPVHLYVDHVKHIAGIRTDEEGTKAYATTNIIGVGSADLFPDVIVEKPFVYFIRAGKNGLVLFSGVVNNPAKS